MLPVTLPAIITPSFIQGIRTHSKLPHHTWYFIAGVTLSALNRPDEIPAVFRYAIDHGPGKEDIKPDIAEQLNIARKMREALVKMVPIGGLPKV